MTDGQATYQASPVQRQLKAFVTSAGAQLGRHCALTGLGPHFPNKLSVNLRE